MEIEVDCTSFARTRCLDGKYSRFEIRSGFDAGFLDASWVAWRIYDEKEKFSRKWAFFTDQYLRFSLALVELGGNFTLLLLQNDRVVFKSQYDVNYVVSEF